MKCEKCKQNEACYHSTLIINGNTKSMHLCAECAKKEGVLNETPDRFFKNFFKDFNDVFSFDFNKFDNLLCPTCNSSFGDFRLNNFTGCPDCFETFKEDLMDSVDDKIEFNTPQKSKEEIELEKLKESLKSAIKDERYEDASEINKQIKKLKEKYNID